MPLKDILVHVDNTKQCEVRLETAINLALAHEAHLTGLYVLTHHYIPPYLRAQFSAESLEVPVRAAIQAAEQAEALFLDKTKHAGVASEWRRVEGETIDVLSLHSRYSDIAVVGQRDPEGDEVTGDSEMPDRLILSVGRPILVVPYVGNYPNIGQRIMVAWDSSRLATRAVNDALPLLERAKQVVVMAINPHGGAEGHGDVPSADICLHLSRHGIKAEAQHVQVEDVEVGDMLLSRAADEGIDMFVMGAYGHARWRELVLGGVTRHMLNHMTAPALMSH